MAQRSEFWFGAVRIGQFREFRAGEASLEQEDQLVFGPFRLDVSAKRLWRGAQEVPLQPQPLAVLRSLVERGGQLVSKEVLLKEAWPGTWVSKSALKGCVHAIRAALGDDAAAPRYVETVGRLGYRFLSAESARAPDADAARGDARPVVARVLERDRLRDCLALVHRGSRQVVFRHGGARNREDDDRGPVPGGRAGERRGQRRERAVSGTVRRGRGVFAGAGSPGAAL